MDNARKLSEMALERTTVEEMVRIVIGAILGDQDLVDAIAARHDPNSLGAGDLIFPANALATCLRAYGYRKAP